MCHAYPGAWKLVINFVKDVDFVFDNLCKQAFDELKAHLISPLILSAPDWTLPFELACDASNSAVGVMLSQKRSKLSHVIAYASKTLDSAQKNYTTTEKELFAVIFALDKFRQYLINSKVVVYTDHAAVKFLFSKPQSKPRLIRWMLLLQEFDTSIKDRSRTANLIVDHFSKLPDCTRGVLDSDLICDDFPDSSLMSIFVYIPWFADLVNYIVTGLIPEHMSSFQAQKLKREVEHYI